MNQLIAVPSETPGGLETAVGEHFGHCDMYTLVRVETGRVADVSVIANIPHQEGGCMAPVRHLAQQGVTQMIAGGMGMRPLMRFNQSGIDVYFGNGVRSVREAVQALLDGKLKPFGRKNMCKAERDFNSSPRAVFR